MVEITGPCVMRLFSLSHGNVEYVTPPPGDAKADAIAETVARAAHGQEPKLGPYLRFYDPEADDGRGYWKWTGNKKLARVFANLEEAFECWRAVPRCHPVRLSDGKPNRPLTQFNVTFENAEP